MNVRPKKKPARRKKPMSDNEEVQQPSDSERITKLEERLDKLDQVLAGHGITEGNLAVPPSPPATEEPTSEGEPQPAEVT
jgi:hypothetical protein